MGHSWRKLAVFSALSNFATIHNPLVVQLTVFSKSAFTGQPFLPGTGRP